MKPGMKMLAATTARGRNDGFRNENAGMNYVEDRFRDRRGREHYDNGRFAPVRNGYGGDMRMEDDTDMRMSYSNPENRRYRRYRNGRFAPRSEYEAESYVPPYAPPVYEEDESRMRTIGFNGAESHWDGDHSRVVPLHGGAAAHSHKFNKRMAEDWMNGIKNEDGRQGPRWTEDQTRQVMKQRSIDCDPIEFWVAMNVMFSDYGKVFSKYGMGDRTEFYADMAKAFLDDKDAVDNKLAMYYECIVED